MFRSGSGSREEVWRTSSPDDARRGALVQCAVARSVMAAARGAGVALDTTCEESLCVVERWCQGDATAAEVRTAAREVMLLQLGVAEERDALRAWRQRMYEEVLRACDDARDSLDGSPLERPSQMSTI